MTNAKESDFDLGDVVTASAAKQIAENIRSAILQGKLKVDVRLPSEDELAAKFNVSRPTIREALKRLAAQHLIRSRRGPTGGNFVTTPGLPEAGRSLANSTTLMVAVGDINVDQIVTARLELESVCVKLACEHRTNDHLEAMRTELELQKKVNLTDEEFCDTDVRFHRAIVDATGNALMQFLMHSVIEGLQPISNLIIFRVRERQEIVSFHKRIFTAIADRKKTLAVEALTELAGYTRDRLAAAINRRS